MDWTVKVTDLAIVFATFSGPVAALWMQRMIDSRREQHQRRLDIFRTLMIQRLRLTQGHVDAINAVPLEFSDKKGSIGEVRTAWKVYLNHMTKDPEEASWQAGRVRLFIDLLQKMGKFLDYDFDPVELEQEFYFPKGHVSLSSDQDVIRQGLAEVLGGKRSLPMEVTTFPSDPAYIAQIRAVLTKLENWLGKQAGQ
ncbi:MAG: hypothetical protein M3N82_08375 [Pseudomonadota bacterium]|nr:hypothetical protein [Pseudomonadota bacterium]